MGTEQDTQGTKGNGPHFPKDAARSLVRNIWAKGRSVVVPCQVGSHDPKPDFWTSLPDPCGMRFLADLEDITDPFA